MKHLTEFDVEDAILMLADIIRDKRELEEENFKLRKQLEEHEAFLDASYQRTMKMTGAMLDAIAEGCIRGCFKPEEEV